ncbi:ergothioneine biosynthesis protein EgtB [Roseateles sp. DXS20W]|uniref:Ergothioneine biosynthesis protein EgtB n=1 Tax=Pelomonas lactea TaxID=3299030 RepID=A0ABW7GJH0_9BURK
MSTRLLPDLLRATRAHSLALAAPLSDEDAQLQSMPDASPAKWHLAHTTWFFETLVLQPHLPGYRVFDERWPRLFNSYYESLGPRHARPQRGLLSRPSLDEVKAYRRHVDAALADLLPAASAEARALIELGCHHEQQHQELLLTDILHAFSCNPLLPAYDAAPPAPAAPPAQAWLQHPGGIVEIGFDGAAGDGFAFDNEGPRHAALLAPFEISNRLVTCGEYADFIASGGYREPLLWLSDGWATVQAQGWQRPAYWLPDGSVFGLHGVQPLDPGAPVSQLSFYEACAFAEWAGARLPTEFEWEAACRLPGFHQAADQAWQWTRSSYAPYPGFKPAPGAVGEYNGKFMVGQQVLRGGSVATPAGHARPSYRNFFPPAARWQFSGVRLAR